MHRFHRSLVGLTLGTVAIVASPAMAEVVEARDDHFITRTEAVVDASAKETWLALISPAGWWSSEHTWSADAANLKLTPQAGGCFCETIPEVDEPGRFTLQGSVEHMRVIQAYPEVALRMSGALGPLQSEPVTGILTIALSEADAGEDGEARTKIVWEYNVGGKMRYPVPVISNAVDGVMTLQLTRLAELLGPVELPGSEEDVEEAPAEESASAELSEEEGAATIEAQEVLDDGEAQEDGAAVEDSGEGPEGPSVDEAFGDLSGDQG
ncbi:SRPBCC family protein [Erythrobacter longus]|uniref:SRPBCC family protein n=1 Tax=Erythrobacter longus TaxID=1044 RepID=UPI000A3E0C62|nr:SRPBCC family protein [Erythrobacter longus]